MCKFLNVINDTFFFFNKKKTRRKKITSRLLELSIVVGKRCDSRAGLFFLIFLSFTGKGAMEFPSIPALFHVLNIERRTLFLSVDHFSRTLFLY